MQVSAWVAGIWIMERQQNMLYMEQRRSLTKSGVRGTNEHLETAMLSP